MTIDNPNNTVVGNNTHDATVRLKTYGDRYFMFFNAFNVEVVQPESMKKEATPLIVSNDCIDVETNASEKVISKKAKNKKAVKSVAITTKTTTNLI